MPRASAGNPRNGRRLLAFALLAVLAVAAGGAQEATFADRVEVRRLLLEVRVLDRRGEPLPGLGPDDFVVTFDGEPVLVEAIDRPGEELPYLQDGSPDATLVPLPVPIGRLIVLFFQRHHLPSRARGLQRMIHEARALVAELGPDDYAAVLSFDSRLHLHTDFTTDHERLLAALDSINPFRPVDLSDSQPPPVSVRLPDRTANGIRTVERAIEILAHLLEPLPGAKSLLFFGWGLGDHWAGTVRSGPDLRRAQAAFVRGKTAFIALDVTQADFHTLELLLHEIAHDTGGRYFRTYHQPEGTMAAATATVAAHYRLTVVPPPGLAGEVRLSVRLREARGEVLHPPRILVPPSGD
jgi:VWFA-related protein